MNYEIQKRKKFQELKTYSNERFWGEMNKLHSQAYFKAVDHYREAAEIVLPPRYQKLLHEKVDEIRTHWDGIDNVAIKFDELTLTEILVEVQKEMSRARAIHGPVFGTIDTAREAIDEEYAEVWEAIDQGNYPHAGVEIIQLIGVLIKLLRELK